MREATVVKWERRLSQGYDVRTRVKYAEGGGPKFGNPCLRQESSLLGLRWVSQETRSDKGEERWMREGNGEGKIGTSANEARRGQVGSEGGRGWRTAALRDTVGGVMG